MNEPRRPGDPAGRPGAEGRAPLPEVGRTWALPGVATDPSRPDIGVLPILTVASSVSVYTGDPGADPVDVLLSGLLGRGFTLLTGVSMAELGGLPVLPDWSARYEGAELRIVEPGGWFYLGDVGPAVPPSWLSALRARRQLVVLVCSGEVDLFRVDRDVQLRRAQQHGEVVAAQIPAQVR